MAQRRKPMNDDATDESNLLGLQIVDSVSTIVTLSATLSRFGPSQSLLLSHSKENSVGGNRQSAVEKNVGRLR